MSLPSRFWTNTLTKLGYRRVKNRRKTESHQARQHSVETLEPRHLLSASPTPLPFETEEWQTDEVVETSAPVETATAELPSVEIPGMVLVDPRPDQFEGQVIYLDFDGAQGVTYDGPVTVGPFDVGCMKLNGF